MAVVNFDGQLRPNEMFATLFNTIISHEVFADNVKGTFSDLVDMARVDGGLYGDTKLYTSVDVLASRPWAVNPSTGKTDKLGVQNEANNLLALEYPDDPKTQAITLDKFRIIKLSVDNYLSKRAWTSEGSFSSFISVITGMMRETKRLYDAMTYNVFLGTHVSNGADQQIEIDVSDLTEGNTNVEKQKYNELVGQRIGETMANIMVDLKNPGRKFNDYGFMRSYTGDELVAVWSSKNINKIKYTDLPSIFHKDAVTNDIKFAEEVLPSIYFGNIVETGEVSNGTQRALVESKYDSIDKMPSELIPTGKQLSENEAYIEDDSILLKLYHRRSVPFMSAFETGTNFFNPQSLTETKFLIWGHNTLTHLYNYPFITIKLKKA